MTETEHLEIVERKTAQYFEVPCRLGAALGGASARGIATLSQYGRALGIAYELTNEAMSAAGRPSKLAR
jgi:geranylgeranyl pyrophosphate synthase